MITLKQGNLLEAKVEALVNTVNCVGIMGKGIALQFKQAFPANYDAYARACRHGEVRIGRMFVYETGDMFYPKYIINFPTKRHWKAKSRIEDIELGLIDLIKVIRKHEINSIAVPPLGSGLGGLVWEEVKKRIKRAFEEVPQVEVSIYEPKGSPKSDQIPIRTEKPKMTRARALLIRLLDIYRKQGYRHSLLEIQKLTYFLQAAGENLKLNFDRRHYGPYAENLNHVLQKLDGHYIRGYGDRSGKSEIYLLEGAIEEAQKFLERDEDANARLEKIAEVIQGFETPYGMELLSTVLWIANETPNVKEDALEAVEKVQEWSVRKKFKMQPQHIQKAWDRLRKADWLKAA